ncbi:MAG TPA: hypothetical protein HA354_03955, partial [Candidatus Poseidoniaceae archaeon]
RTRQEAIPAIEGILGDVTVEIDNDDVIALLNNEAILKQDMLPETMSDYCGPLIFTSNVAGCRTLVSAWSGTWISLMIGTTERDIIRAKLGLPFEHEVEEE